MPTSLCSFFDNIGVDVVVVNDDNGTIVTPLLLLMPFFDDKILAVAIVADEVDKNNGGRGFFLDVKRAALFNNIIVFSFPNVPLFAFWDEENDIISAMQLSCSIRF